MYQDTIDKFQSISSFEKDTEKYVEDVKLNKDKYNNYWIKTIMVNNMSSSISFSGRAFSISGMKFKFQNLSGIQNEKKQ